MLRWGQVSVVLELLLSPRRSRETGCQHWPQPQAPERCSEGGVGLRSGPLPQYSGSSMGGGSGGGRLVLAVWKEARWHPCLSSAVLFYTNTIFQTCTLGRELVEMSLWGSCHG